MLIKGRDKPHIYKHNGYYYCIVVNNPTLWQWRAARAYVNRMNSLIKEHNQ